MGDVEKADGFCYLEDAINSSGGCEIAVHGEKMQIGGG